LVNEVHKSLVKQNGYFCSGKCEQFKKIPYSALIQVFFVIFLNFFNIVYIIFIFTYEQQAINQLIQRILTENEENLQIWKQKLLESVGKFGKMITDIIPDVELIIGILLYHIFIIILLLFYCYFVILFFHCYIIIPNLFVCYFIRSPARYSPFSEPRRLCVSV
jgi:predicted ATPase